MIIKSITICVVIILIIRTEIHKTQLLQTLKLQASILSFVVHMQQIIGYSTLLMS